MARKAAGAPRAPKAPKARKTPKERKVPVILEQETEPNGCPKRMKISYMYAIGIALKNSPAPLGSADICNFIRVHMPKICRYENNNWENCVRSYLALAKWIQKYDYTPDGQKRTEAFYTISELQTWEELFPKTYGYPYAFLTYRELHEDLYEGKVGFPNEAEIIEATIKFEEERKPYRVFKEKKKRKAKDNGKNAASAGEPKAKRMKQAMEEKLIQLKNKKAQLELEQLQDETERAINGIKDIYRDTVEYEEDYVPQGDEFYDDMDQEEQELYEFIEEGEDDYDILGDEQMPQLQQCQEWNERVEYYVEEQGHVAPTPGFENYNQENAPLVYEEWNPEMIPNEMHNLEQNQLYEKVQHNKMTIEPFQNLTNVSYGSCNLKQYVQHDHAYENFESFLQPNRAVDEPVHRAVQRNKIPSVLQPVPNPYANQELSTPSASQINKIQENQSRSSVIEKASEIMKAAVTKKTKRPLILRNSTFARRKKVDLTSTLILQTTPEPVSNSSHEDSLLSDLYEGFDWNQLKILPEVSERMDEYLR